MAIEEYLLPQPPQKVLLPIPPKKIILGGEYVNLATPRKPTKGQKKTIDHTIDRLKGKSEDEAKWAFEGGTGAYTPVLKEYTETFWNIIKDQTKVKSDYDMFKSTSLYERYLLNSVQFASAKSVAENGMMKSVLFDSDGVRQSFSAFKRDCKAITDVTNETWLRVEYDFAVRQSVTGEQFQSYKDDADLMPYWIYLETISENPRESHLELVGNIYRIGDPEGDAVFPSNGWNCECGSEQVDDDYLKQNGKSVRTNDEAKSDLDKHVDPQFRYNASDQGILPKEGHSYFQALSSANEADSNTFSDD